MDDNMDDNKAIWMITWTITWTITCYSTANSKGEYTAAQSQSIKISRRPITGLCCFCREVEEFGLKRTFLFFLKTSHTPRSQRLNLHLGTRIVGTAFISQTCTICISQVLHLEHLSLLNVLYTVIVKAVTVCTSDFHIKHLRSGVEGDSCI